MAEELWQMTLEEYLRRRTYDEDQFRRVMADQITGSTMFKAQHYVAVRNAFDAGEPVPPEVLADYPDL